MSLTVKPSGGSELPGRCGCPGRRPRRDPRPEVDCARERRARPTGTAVGHVVVGAGVETDDDVELVTARRQDQHRHRGVVGPDATTDLEPVDIREAEVEDHEITGGSRPPSQRVPARGDNLDAAPVAAQRPAQRLGDRRVVLNEQHARHIQTIRDRPAAVRRAAHAVRRL